VASALQRRFPDARVLLHETGRCIRAEVAGAASPEGFDKDKLEIAGIDDRRRLDSIAFRP
jgi:hypothetical protein